MQTAALMLLCGLAASARAEEPTIVGGAAPTLCSDGAGGVYLADREGEHVCVRRSGDAGRTWSSAVNVASAPGGSGLDMAVDRSGAVDLVWSGGSKHPGILFARSTNAGTSWSAARTVAAASQDASAPALAVGADYQVEVVWSQDKGVRETRSQDAGVSWSPVHTLSGDNPSGQRPVVALDRAGIVHVAWCDGSRLLYVRGGGQGWQSALETSPASSPPALAVDGGGDVCLAWNDPSAVWFATTTAGHQLTQRTRLVRSIGSHSGSLATSGEQLALVWTDSSGVYLEQSANGGVGWGQTEPVAPAVVGSAVPTVAIASGKAIVIWQAQDGLKCRSVQLHSHHGGGR